MKWLRWGLLLIGCGGTAAAQQGPIDPNWVYITPVKWVRPRADLHAPWAAVRVVVLYPEGRYAEVGGVLIRAEKDKPVGFSAGDGLVIRSGTWSRTDDRVIRIHAEDVYRDVPLIRAPCGLEGQSKTHLAQTIHCHRLIVSPLTLNLDLDALAQYARTQAKP
jgi:hypothetical protein